MTLRCVEKGEPSVTMGAYLSAMSAVGLSLQVCEPEAEFAAAVPSVVRLDGYPALKQLAWPFTAPVADRPGAVLTPARELRAVTTVSTAGTSSTWP